MIRTGQIRLSSPGVEYLNTPVLTIIVTITIDSVMFDLLEYMPLMSAARPGAEVNLDAKD